MILNSGPVVRLTLWDNVALNFRKRLTKHVSKPVVLIATTVNPRKIKDMFCLSSTSSTRIFLDNDVDPTTEYLTWLGEDTKNASIVVNNFTLEVVKPEPVTISGLYQFLKNDTPQKALFSCIATIVSISPQYGWFYIACTKCACKLERGDTTLECKTCNNKNAVGVVRYRVELSVYDNDNVATFVLFDREAYKLTGMRAADILEAFMQGDDNGVIGNHTSIPQCLLDVVGHTYKFQVTLTPYNYIATRQTITVSRIFEKVTGGDEKTPQDKTADDDDDNDDDDDTVGSKHKKKRMRQAGLRFTTTSSIY
ncbi:PREDICTED: uncharacterized protein LOC104763153 [Camelina sativa]|uniref:Uncharacterized protein LOC104763153 n=1 Tax=Camelina sativa TaxID=90675 RepID=A0ABM0XES0_CAMSA|nr:PREDICTED: uncharacterized protein LOC104763153 [Camelina sativa]